MPEEIEAKVRIASPEALRRRMAARGLAEGEAILEVNRLFDDAARSLQRSGSALRLREEQRPAGGAILRTILTYKGPRAKSRMKRRPEVELAVEAAASLVAILEALGFAETFYYEKHRTCWHVGECEVALDELPHLGWFVEVEGPTEETVLVILADLDLAAEPLVNQTYIELLSTHLADRGLGPSRAAFEE